MRRAFLFAIVTCLAASSGCALLRGLGGFRRPTLSFQRVQVKDASFGGATLELHYNLNNGNAFPMPLAGTRYRLSVEGKQIFAGQSAGGSSVPAHGNRALVFPLQLRFSELTLPLQEILRRDRLPYRAEGELRFDTGAGAVTLPWSRAGELEVPKLPELTVGEPRVEGIDAGGMVLELPLRLQNRNSYPLPIANLAGGLRIDGTDVGTVATDKFSVLEPGGQREISLPLTIQAKGVAAVMTALRRGRGRLSLEGSMRSGVTALPFEWEALRQFRR